MEINVKWPSYIQFLRQQLSADALQAEFDREYALKQDVDFLHRQSSLSPYLPHFIYFPCDTLLHQAEVVWLSGWKMLNTEECL